MYKGVTLSIIASCLFAGLYYYSTLLKPLNGEEIFGWRMLLTLPCVTLFMIVGKEWKLVAAIFVRIRRKPMLLPALCLSSALLGIQQWLFLWAPVNGRGLNVSLGYFLLPLAMLLVGRLVYRERLSPLQKLAALSAVSGVAHELYQIGGFSWEALLVAAGLPAYFVLRRKLATAHLGGLWFDMLLMLPFAAWFAMIRSSTADYVTYAPRLYFMLLFLAIISAAAFMSYIVASRLLPFGLFGLLGYVEPVLMVCVSLLLGEQIQTKEWLTYIPIWVAVGFLAIDGALHIRRDKTGHKPQKRTPS